TCRRDSGALQRAEFVSSKGDLARTAQKCEYFQEPGTSRPRRSPSDLHAIPEGFWGIPPGWKRNRTVAVRPFACDALDSAHLDQILLHESLISCRQFVFQDCGDEFFDSCAAAALGNDIRLGFQ